MAKGVLRTKGGPGSGHFGHAGRPGKVGGSVPGKGSNLDAILASMLGKKPGDFAGRNKAEGLPWQVTAVYTDWLYHVNKMGENDTKYMSWELYDEEGNYTGYDSVDATKQELEQALDVLKGMYDERMDYVRRMIPVPENGKAFLRDAGLPEDLDFGNKDFESVYGISRQEAVDRIYQYTRDYVVYEGGYDPTQFSSRELSDILIDNYTDIPMWTMDSIGQAIHKFHEFDTKELIANGTIDPKYAESMGLYQVSQPQGREWQNLPDTLYHATTNYQAIVNDRIRSRMELGQKNGLGLGGGEDDTISYGVDKDIVLNIERSLHEAHAVANGHITMETMWQAASSGAGNGGIPYRDKLFSMLFGNLADSDHAQDTYNKLIDAEYGDRSYLTSDADLFRKRMDVYNSFMYARQSAGGYEDPLFFGTDFHGLANLDPGEFKTLVYKPKSGARGYVMGSLSEWRSVGNNVELLDVLDAIAVDYDDPNYIYEVMGFEGYGH